MYLVVAICVECSGLACFYICRVYVSLVCVMYLLLYWKYVAVLRTKKVLTLFPKLVLPMWSCEVSKIIFVAYRT